MRPSRKEKRHRSVSEDGCGAASAVDFTGAGESGRDADGADAESFVCRIVRVVFCLIFYFTMRVKRGAPRLRSGIRTGDGEAGRILGQDEEQTILAS